MTNKDKKKVLRKSVDNTVTVATYTGRHQFDHVYIKGPCMVRIHKGELIVQTGSDFTGYVEALYEEVND